MSAINLESMEVRHFGQLLLAAVFVWITIASASEAVAGPRSAGAAKVEPLLTNRFGTARWEWLEDTYWYVPQSNLKAFVFLPELNALREFSDQTVFHITEYSGGYFWGKTVVDLTPVGGRVSDQPSCLSLVGSVTPEGKVFLTFTIVNQGQMSGDPQQPPAPTQGLGMMRFDPKFGGWTIEPQMSAVAGAAVQVNHWAYMVQSVEGQASWASLPGVGIPLLDFLQSCPTEAPALISN